MKYSFFAIKPMLLLLLNYSNEEKEGIVTFVRRYCVLLAIMFWQGGFTFYGAVVVPVGNQVLGSHLEQGFVTRTVTNYLNIAGIVALGMWVWDIASASDGAVVRRRLRWVLWLLLLLTLGLLGWLHMLLDQLLDADSFRILDRPRFRYLHVWYLNISTVQWADGLLLTALTLLAWRSEDKTGEEALLEPHVKEFDLTGRAMKS